MNLLTFTKRISKQVAYYDALAKESSVNNVNVTNPFSQPINITIVWVDENDCDE